MKNFAAFLLLLTLAAFTVGCEKKKEAPAPEGGAPPAAEEPAAEKPAEGG